MKLEATGGRSLTALDESGCLLIPGGKVLRYLAEVPFFVAIIVCWIWLAVVIVLASTERIPKEKAMVLLAASLGVALVLRSVRSVLVKTLLRWRADGFLTEFRGLESRPIALEEGLTIKKVKFLTEDEGVCLMDPQRQRLLIEGCSYRYLVYAKDIYSLRPISA
jgi:hypothetical protein